MSIGLYIHIPFCQQKCLYCDFPSVAGREDLYAAYTAALCREIAGKGGLLSVCTVDTVYIGGGTPTVLPAGCLEELGRCLRANVAVAAGAEFTFEANPGTLDGDKLAVLRANGANRVSLGVQAFDDGVLAAAGRIHTAAQAAEAVAAVRKAGFGRISIDLMYGLPGQTAAGFRAGLEQAAALPVEHVSVYGLKVEEGTPFARLAAEGRLVLPDEAEDEAMYDLAASFLPARGFARYEISNYARPGAECRHNLRYWRYEPYIGVGAAAHSFWQGERLANTADVQEYIARALAGESPLASRERPEAAVAMAEYAFLALRTAAGVSYEDFAARFGREFPRLYGAAADKLARQGLVTAGEGSLRLTEKGQKFGNIVFAAFLPD
ncbi:radical SAM family heme chaperone HemW [Anaeroselena agilis]|uniref:Heme chaperone HemW n=1 Tax=Anaeroselena agilis TaxID=3063788 RepID=A0ABU3P1M1_9FIRM|nr:radical SAM family heme chaperone HemW [Selenomonadales bacterium 4137-cl]